MAATVIGEAAIELLADGSGFAQDIKNKVGGGIRALGTAMTAGVTAPIVAGLGLATKAAAEEEQQMMTLANVIKNNVVGATDAMIDANEEWVTALQNSIGVADSDIRDLQQRFIAAGVSIKDAQKLTAQAFDTAAATGKDATSVADAFVKATNGQVSGLSRLGVQVKDVDGKMKSFDQILTDLAVHQGTAAAAMDNSAGRAQIMQLRMGDLIEDIGFVLLPILDKLTTWLAKVTEWFSNLSPGVKEGAVAVAAVAAAIGPVLLILPKLVAGFKAVMVVFNALKLLFMTNPWTLLIAAVVALVVLIVANWDKIVAFLKKTWDWIKRTAAAVWQGIKDAINSVVRFITNLFLNWTIAGLIIKHWDKIKEGVRKLVDWIKNAFSAVIDWFKNLPSKLFNAGKNIIQGLWDGIKEKVKAMIKWVEDNVVGKIKDLWPFSPAKAGPFKGSGSPFHAGQNIMSELARGLASGSKLATATALGTTGDIAGTLGSGMGGGSRIGTSIGQVSIQVTLTGSATRQDGETVADAIESRLRRMADAAVVA